MSIAKTGVTVPRKDNAPGPTRTFADDFEFGWAVGIYEGEGCASTYHGSTSVSVGQRDDWLLSKFVELFGGRIYRTPNSVSRWQVGGELARNFLILVYPHLSPRRQAQARKAMNTRVDRLPL